jgi:hypothetical protein
MRKKSLITPLSTPMSLQHRLRDSSGNLVSRNTDGGMRLRAKIRCVDQDGNVMNTQNTTIYPGRRFMLELLTRQIPRAQQQMTLNQLLNINANITVPNSSLIERMICLVGLGRGGATLQFSDVLDARASDLNIFDQIPFRTVPVNADLPSEERAKYFMRTIKVINEQTYYAYYLKKITPSEIYVKHQETNYVPKPEDNNPEKNPSDPLSLYPIQIFLTIPIDISSKDVKEFYIAEDGNLRKSRFNEMSIYFGVPVKLRDPINNDEYTDYVSVEAFSHLTFNNKGMDTEGASFQFNYDIIT